MYNDISTGGVFEEGGLDQKHIFLTIHDAVLFALANIKEVVHPPILEEVTFAPGLLLLYLTVLYYQIHTPCQHKERTTRYCT